MASTAAPHKSTDAHKQATPKTKHTKLSDTENDLVHRLEEHYGTEFSDDKDKFIKDCVAAEKKIIKEGEDDPQVEAKYDSLIGQLRKMWTNYDEGKKETDEQGEIRQALDDADINVGLSFPDDKSWVMNAGGKEDSGHISQGADAIVSAARRLTNQEE